MDTKRATHRTTDRLLDILELVAMQPGALTLTEIGRDLSIPKSTLSPILYTLTARGFLAADPLGHYTIGVSAYLLGQSFLSRFRFLEEVERVLQDITHTCMEASHFAALAEGGDNIYLKKAESPQPIRMVSSVGRKLPAYATALGKALLSDLSKEELLALYPGGLSPLTPYTITDFDELYRQLLLVREEGFAYESEESNESIQCIAVPVCKEGRIVAALSIATPVFRYNEEKASLIRSLLLDGKQKIEKLLSTLDIDLADLGLI